MNHHPFDDLLAAYSKEPLPQPPPGDGNAGVWQEIEARRRRSFWARFLPSLEWRELFLEPRLAGAALLITVVMGVLPGYFLVSRSNDDARLAQRSLHFEVFSPAATDILSNRQFAAKL